MINIHTGQPGAGKTLMTIQHVMQYQHRENEELARLHAEEGGDLVYRDVYYNGIKDCVVPGWIEFENAEEWYKLPVGSIIFIDECQRVWRPRHFSGGVPEHVAMFETHRHRGYDIFLVTQSPGLIDQNIRKLTGVHRHVMRGFGWKAGVIHEWNEVREKPERKSQRVDSNKTPFVHDKKVYDYYKSAELHTHRAHFPKKLMWLIAMPFIAVVMFYVAWRFMHRLSAPEDKPVEASRMSASVPGRLGGGDPPTHPTLQQFADLRRPRIQGLPATAPIYDEITKPSVAPKPVACVSTPKECRCYTQQGTRILDTVEMTCRSIVESGYFDDSPEQKPNDWRRQDASAAVASATIPPARSVIYDQPAATVNDSALALATEGRGKALPRPSSALPAKP